MRAHSYVAHVGRTAASLAGGGRKAQVSRLARQWVILPRQMQSHAASRATSPCGIGVRSRHSGVDRCFSTHAASFALPDQFEDDGPTNAYMEKVRRQELSADTSQLAALALLEDLHVRLKGHVPPDLEVQDKMVVDLVQQTREAAKEKERQDAIDKESAKYHLEDVAEKETPVQEDVPLGGHSIASFGSVPTGLYLWGSVGCGKTMLMDLFFENAVVEDNRKQRVHFHSFMRDLMKHLHILSSQATDAHKERYDYNLLRPIAKGIAKQSVLLCFDEIQIPDIGTAALLYRIFKHLQEYGVTVVATSNQCPEQLYQGHFCETYFEPWVELMSTQWEVHEVKATSDYRRQLFEQADQLLFDPHNDFAPNYFSPLGLDTHRKFELCWQACTADQQIQASEFYNAARRIEIPSCTSDGVARFGFGEICDRNLGPKDYLAIAQKYHTVFVGDIPRMNMHRRDQARRLISLIDALYECGTKIYISAEIEPDRLFDDVADFEIERYDPMHREAMGEMFSEMSYGDQVFQNKLFTGAEELFASARCVSRIIEMQSPQYKESPHRPHLAIAGLDDTCLELGEEGGTVSASPISPYAAEAFGYQPKEEEAPPKDPRPRFSQRLLRRLNRIKKLEFI